MRSNRTIQTIVQAITLVIVAAIFFRLPDPRELRGGGAAGGGRAAALDHKALARAYRVYFDDWNRGELPAKAELLSVNVEDVCPEGLTAQVKLRVEIRWKSHNIQYKTGPLKNAPGQRGDRVTYWEVFTYRCWGAGGDAHWDVEGRLKPPIIQ